MSDAAIFIIVSCLRKPETYFVILMYIALSVQHASVCDAVVLCQDVSAK